MSAVVPEAVWTVRRAAHEARVDTWIRPHLERRRRREKHPVEDFLFTYYSHRPARLRRWHPGAGVALAGERARDLLEIRGFVETPQGVVLDPKEIERRTTSIEWVRHLLRETADRPGYFGCFGLHEWAMVYRTEGIRHEDWPLRLGSKRTDEVVEAHRIRCSHFDAFRFFTAEARPRNQLAPTRERQAELDNPGCLHVNMDLYKWAYKLDPLLPAELVADCFELARDIRVVDMRASPYDLSGLGLDPIAIETPEGKAAYAAAQREFAARARPLREALVEHCDELLSQAPDPSRGSLPR